MKTNRKHEVPLRYDAAFKEGTIKLVTEGGRPMREVAEELGVCTDTIRPTGQGWLYLAVIKDLCTKKIVGYAFSNCIDTALTLAALRMAVNREHPQPGLMFHSDRGVQYAATAYREELEKLGFIQSMSRKGEPHDNAVAENFFSCLKCEQVYLQSYATRAQAQNSVFQYIETFYNLVRPHFGIGWLAPVEFEQRLRTQNAA